MANTEEISSKTPENISNCISRIWNPAIEENSTNNINNSEVIIEKTNDFFHSKIALNLSSPKRFKKFPNKDGNLVDSILENRINEINSIQQQQEIPHLLKSPQMLLNVKN